MCTSLLQPQGKVTTGKNRPTAQFDRVAPIRAADVPLGTGIADIGKQAILTRREKMRIALEGS